MGALAESDGYGMAAFTCGVDGSALEPVAETAGVLRCPTCAHRTDQPGDGVLGDGSPGPPRPRRDVGRLGWPRVVAHEGHSTAGRTISRPAPRVTPGPRCEPELGGGCDNDTGRTARKVLGDIVVWGLVLAIPAALLGGGGFLLYQRAVGTRVEATVLECDTSGAIVRGASTSRTDCIAEWEIDDRTVIGPFTGGNGESDVGKTVDATVRGDTVYSRSLGLPILLLALGLPFLAIPSLAIRAKWRARVS